MIVQHAFSPNAKQTRSRGAGAPPRRVSRILIGGMDATMFGTAVVTSTLSLPQKYSATGQLLRKQPWIAY
jgi:hypothetical protein